MNKWIGFVLFFTRLLLCIIVSTCGFASAEVVTLKSMANGKYVCADNYGKSPLIANRTVASTWEQFEKIDLGNGSFAFKALANGKYVCADNYGKNPIIANRDVAQTWESFWIQDMGAGKIALKAVVNNKFVCADNYGNSPLIANRNAALAWETYEMAVVIPPNPGWTLVWSDEFNGPGIDTGKWNFEVNGGGGGNNELQYYTNRPQNAFIENGKLIIQALKEYYCGSDGCRDYTSARLNSANKGDFLYGRYEARAKLPRGKGLWPAIWMLPTDNVYGIWPQSGEIDIMEAVNTNAGGGNTVYGSIHYGPPWPNNLHQTAGYTPATSIADNFHVYAIEWDPTEIRYYVDDVLYGKFNNWWTAGGSYPAPFNKRFHWILNVAVGGNWPGNPDGSSQFPQRMEIDWVRVYRK